MSGSGAYFSSSLHYASSTQILSNSASESLDLFITSCKRLGVWMTFGRWNNCNYLLAEVVDPLLSLKAWSIDEHNERLLDRAERANDMSGGNQMEEQVRLARVNPPACLEPASRRTTSSKVASSRHRSPRNMQDILNHHIIYHAMAGFKEHCGEACKT